MDSFCIFTDDAAQFTHHNKLSDVHLEIINHQYNPTHFSTFTSPQIYQELLAVDQVPIITPPKLSELAKIIREMSLNYNEVFFITMANGIDSIYSLVLEMCSKNQGKARFHIIDTQSISAGEGHLIDCVSNLINQHASGSTIEERIREIIPNIYTLLCAPNLSFLHTAGFLDIGQTILGETLSLIPVFSLEDGKLNPLEKYKNHQSVIEFFIEFISEFENLEKIVFLQPALLALDTNPVKQYVKEFLPATQYFELKTSPFLVSLIGPRGYGLIVIEKT
jgi:DegV family protein with EDD domain